MNKTELAIQKAVIEFVHLQYKDVIITGTNNEANRHDTRAIGCKGITDLILFRRKDDVLYTLFLELKTNGKGLTRRGTLQPSQITFNRVFDTCFVATNAKRTLCYGFDEAITAIKDWYNFT